MAMEGGESRKVNGEGKSDDVEGKKASRMPGAPLVPMGEYDGSSEYLAAGNQGTTGFRIAVAASPVGEIDARCASDRGPQGLQYRGNRETLRGRIVEGTTGLAK